MQRQALIFLLIILTNSGCAVIPPKRIPVDRQEYLEAINTSWKEELLSNIVRLHHGDSLTFLELTGVNTNYSLGGTAQAGYSGNMNFTSKTSGNDLIWSPSTGVIGPNGSASITYSRTPSVTYVPTRGDNLRKMLDPIPQETVMRFIQAYNFAPYILSLMVEDPNDLDKLIIIKIEDDPVDVVQYRVPKRPLRKLPRQEQKAPTNQLKRTLPRLQRL